MENNMSTTPGTAKNVLSSDVEIKGNLKFAGEMAFDGKLEGEIHTDGVLNLGDSAVVNGNITAQSVIVRGKVTGNINAKEKIEIKAKAELFGDIRATKLTVEEGVTFVGRTEVNPNKVTPTASSRPAEPAKSPEAAKPAMR
jgi:cytoskeletal protein CcmA (bactofilin family)